LPLCITTVILSSNLQTKAHNINEKEIKKYEEYNLLFDKSLTMKSVFKKPTADFSGCVFNKVAKCVTAHIKMDFTDINRCSFTPSIAIEDTVDAQ
jgi:hypothetical protein